VAEPTSRFQGLPSGIQAIVRRKESHQFNPLYADGGCYRVLIWDAPTPGPSASKVPARRNGTPSDVGEMSTD
jgi:hypothetical protein